MHAFRALRASLFHPKADLPLPPRPDAPDVDHLRDLVRHLLGEAPVAIEPLPGGTHHHLYRLHRSNDSSIVARTSPPDPMPDHALLLDRFAAARLRAAGLPAVEVLAIDLSRRLCPFDVELLAEAPGVSLARLDDEAALAPLLERLGAFLARVHAIDVSGAGLLAPDEDGAAGSASDWSSYFHNRLDDHLAVCRDTAAITRDEERAIRRAIRERECLLHDAPSRLLHGDPGSPNVFVRDGDVSALIDWEDALAGDPVHEIALWATFHPEHRHEAFLRGYRREAVLGEDFAERFWLYYLRAALAKTVVRHRLGLPDRPGRPPASRRIQLGLERLTGGRWQITNSPHESTALARRVRAHVLRMVHRARASHVGSCFSCADLLAVLYADVMRYRPDEPTWPQRDRLIVSKGHAAAAVYAVLAESGFFPTAWLDRFCEDGTCLAGHVHHGVPGVEVSTGSLGHGLSLACGMALAAKVDVADHRIFVLLSDGECDEGATWEAALFAPHQQLDNLVALVDHNQIQSLGRVSEVLNLEPFADKWRSFGWHVEEVDGHDHDAVREALRQTPRLPGKPTVLLAHTVKGKGVSFMQDALLWHYRSPDDNELSLALAEIEEPCA